MLFIKRMNLHPSILNRQWKWIIRLRTYTFYLTLIYHLLRRVLFILFVPIQIKKIFTLIGLLRYWWQFRTFLFYKINRLHKLEPYSKFNYRFLLMNKTRCLRNYWYRFALLIYSLVTFLLKYPKSRHIFSISEYVISLNEN